MSDNTEEMKLIASQLADTDAARQKLAALVARQALKGLTND